MPLKIIQPTDRIDVSSVSVLIYGAPGVGKTSLAMTAEEPVTLDFDGGVHRSANRKVTMQFDDWNDLQDPKVKEKLDEAKTVVVDTIGRLLDLMAKDIIRLNSKHGSAHAGLSLQGFGALKARFAQWHAQMRLSKKDVIFIAHEREEKDGDNRLMRADITGSSYGEVMKAADVVGYLQMRNGKRVLDCNPTDAWVGKNAPGWQPLQIPDFKSEPKYFAAKLVEAKARMSAMSEASAEAARLVEEWRVRFAACEDASCFNKLFPQLKDLEKVVKVSVWSNMQAAAKGRGLLWDKTANLFADPVKEREAGVEPDESEAA